MSQYGDSLNNENQENINSSQDEKLMVQIEGVSLRVEGYLGGVLTPMLKLDSKVNVDVKNWSNQMFADASLSVQANYYNENVAEWEPIIEPIFEKNRKRPWELNVNVCVFCYDLNLSG